MNGKKENGLIVIENGQLFSYALDDRNCWEIGRPSKENFPDIPLRAATVSRKHGKFQNLDGVWFYLDYRGKNGTIYNHKHMESGLNGRRKPVMLQDGDTFVFGGGEKEVINCKTIWAMFVTEQYDGAWRVVDSKGYDKLQFISNEECITMESPQKGQVIKKEQGMAVYMGDLTYTVGDMEVIGC